MKFHLGLPPINNRKYISGGASWIRLPTGKFRLKKGECKKVEIIIREIK